MGYDYLNDLFGKHRKTASEYVRVEDDAIVLLFKVCNDEISFDELDEGFMSVRRKMVALDNHVVGEGYPLWIDRFLAFRFARWHKWHLLRKMHEERSEEFGTPELESQYQSIADMDLDNIFMEACRDCLKELENRN